jgi:hypothetical protein
VTDDKAIEFQRAGYTFVLRATAGSSSAQPATPAHHRAAGYWPDAPEDDATDAACPAWWRGHDNGAKGITAQVERLKAEHADAQAKIVELEAEAESRAAYLRDEARANEALTGKLRAAENDLRLFHCARCGGDERGMLVCGPCSRAMADEINAVEPEAEPCHKCGKPANINDYDDGLGAPVCCDCYSAEPEAEQPAKCAHCGADTGHYSYCPEAPCAPSKPMLGPVEAFRRELIVALRSAICAHGTGGGVAITVLTVLASSLESDLAGGKRD